MQRDDMNGLKWNKHCLTVTCFATTTVLIFDDCIQLLITELYDKGSHACPTLQL